MSEDPLPPYTYTPGVTPHPISDPAGHSHGRAGSTASIDPSHFREAPAFRHAIHLFRHGYYWEAHEEWESIWHAVGRQGAIADLLKGLIKLAAAGVKAREGNPKGVARHAKRALELFEAAQTSEPLSALVNLDALNTIVREAARLALVSTAYPPLDHGRPVVFWARLASELQRL